MNAMQKIAIFNILNSDDVTTTINCHIFIIHLHRCRLLHLDRKVYCAAVIAGVRTGKRLATLCFSLVSLTGRNRDWRTRISTTSRDIVRVAARSRTCWRR